MGRGMLREVVGKSSIAGLFGPLIDAESLAAEIGEPLRESAPMALATALERCAHESCRSYHAVWQYLRLANLARSVRIDGPIYVAAAERLARMGRLNRVLITATADYSMLAHLVEGARRGGANPAFDVVDRCPTSLHLNDWYGQRIAANVRTIQSDVLAYQSDERYDLVCSHSFVHWLPVETRPRLFEQWRQHLAPEGRVCFSNRVWIGHFKLAPVEMEQRVDRTVATALERLAERGIQLPCASERFAELLRGYGYRRDELPPLPMTEVERWIREAGLAIEIAVPAAEVVPETYERLVGPFSIDRGPRMWFQLRHA
jgi:SAM-dependent methyltransferase